MSYKEEYRERFSQNISGLNELWAEYALESDRRHLSNGNGEEALAEYRKQLLDQLSVLEYQARDINEFVEQDLGHDVNSRKKGMVGEFVTAAINNLDEDVYIEPRTDITNLGHLNEETLFVNGDLGKGTGKRQSGDIHVNGTINSTAGYNMEENALIFAKSAEKFLGNEPKGRFLIYSAEEEEVFEDKYSPDYEGEGLFIVLNGDPEVIPDENSGLDYFIHEGKDVIQGENRSLFGSKENLLEEAGIDPEILYRTRRFLNLAKEEQEKGVSWETAAEFIEESLERNLQVIEEENEENYDELEKTAEEVLEGIGIKNVPEGLTEELKSHLDDYLKTAYAKNYLQSMYEDITDKKNQMDIKADEDASYPMERTVTPQQAQKLLQDVTMAKIEEEGYEVWGEDTVSDGQLDNIIEIYGEDAGIGNPVITFDGFGAQLTFRSDWLQNTETEEGEFDTRVSLSWIPENMQQPHQIFTVPAIRERKQNYEKQVNSQELENIFKTAETVTYRDRTSESWETPNTIPGNMVPEVLDQLGDLGDIEDEITVEREGEQISAVLEVSADDETREMEWLIEGELE